MCESETHYDVDGDGEYETDADALIYDLRFEHRERDQTIWLRTLPIDRPDARKNLDVLMRDYVEALAGSGYAVVTLIKETSIQIRERRYATELIAQQSLKLAERDALLAVFDVANVDQLSVNQQDRKKRVALVLVRTGYQRLVDGAGEFNVPFPVIMVVGYAAYPGEFDEGIEAFEAFTSRIQLRPGTNRWRDGLRTNDELRAVPGLSLAIEPGTIRALIAGAAPATQPAESTPPSPAAEPGAAPAIDASAAAHSP